MRRAVAKESIRKARRIAVFKSGCGIFCWVQKLLLQCLFSGRSTAQNDFLNDRTSQKGRIGMAKDLRAAA
jgi:hypothetical protein